MKKGWGIVFALVLSIMVWGGVKPTSTQAATQTSQSTTQVYFGDTQFLSTKTIKAITKINDRVYKEKKKLGFGLVVAKVNTGDDAYKTLMQHKWPKVIDDGKVMLINPTNGNYWELTGGMTREDLESGKLSKFDKAGLGKWTTMNGLLDEEVADEVDDVSFFYQADHGDDVNLDKHDTALMAKWVDDETDTMNQPASKALLKANTQTLTKVKGKPVIGVVLLNHAPGNDTSLQKVSSKKLRSMKLGNNKYDNGIVIVLSLNDHHYWINSGFGLEQIITENNQDDIVTSTVVKQLKRENYATAVTEIINNTANLVVKHQDKIESPAQVSFDKLKQGLLLLFAIILIGGALLLVRYKLIFEPWVWRALLFIAGLGVYIFGWGVFKMMGAIAMVTGGIVLAQYFLRKYLPRQVYYLVRLALWLGAMYLGMLYFGPQQGADPTIWPKMMVAVVVIWLIHAAFRLQGDLVRQMMISPATQARYPLVQAVVAAGYGESAADEHVAFDIASRPKDMADHALFKWIRTKSGEWLADQRIQQPLPYYYFWDSVDLISGLPEETVLQVADFTALATLLAPGTQHAQTNFGQYQATFEQWSDAFNPASAHEPSAIAATWDNFTKKAAPADQLTADQLTKLWDVIIYSIEHPQTTQNTAYEDWMPSWINDYYWTQHDSDSSSSGSDFGGGGGSDGGGFGGSW